MKKIYCHVFGHQPVISKKVTLHVNEFQYSKCKFQMTTNSKGELTPLTPNYKEINAVLERIHQRRQSKKLEGLLIFKY
ncbi:MAG: hypothetical protein ACSHXF_03645 [Aquaticitalea sp.]